MFLSSVSYNAFIVLLLHAVLVAQTKGIEVYNLRISRACRGEHFSLVKCPDCVYNINCLDVRLVHNRFLLGHIHVEASVAVYLSSLCMMFQLRFARVFALLTHLNNNIIIIIIIIIIIMIIIIIVIIIINNNNNNNNSNNNDNSYIRSKIVTSCQMFCMMGRGLHEPVLQQS